GRSLYVVGGGGADAPSQAARSVSPKRWRAISYRYVQLRSTPIARRPRARATASVVAEPTNGSQTMPGVQCDSSSLAQRGQVWAWTSRPGSGASGSQVQ